MCYNLHPEFIIIDYFSEHQSEDTLSFMRLEKIVNRIKKLSDYSILAETDRANLMNIISSNKNLFDLGPTYISVIQPLRIRKETLPKLRKRYFDYIPQYVKDICKEAISEKNYANR